MMKKQRWYSRSRSSSAPATPRVVEVAPSPASTEYAGANVGCMSMVHHLIFAPGAGCVGRPPPPHSSSAAAAAVNSISGCQFNLAASPCRGKAGAAGLEAPRNSLELDTDQLKDIQIGVQIEPAFDALLPGRRSRATAPSSEAETPRTPSLVARLMGIDGLPDQPSPSPGLKKTRPAMSACGASAKQEDRSAVKEKKKRVIPESMNKERTNRQPLRSLSCNVPAAHGAGDARSLPDTPRASTSSVSARAAAPTWDVLVDRPRLSLQVLKESVLDRAAQYMSMPTSPTSCDAKKKKDRDGYRRRDAKEHAREIVRQAKETVTNRKSGKKPTSTSNKENASPFVEDKLVVVQVQAASSKPTAPPPPPPPQLKARADEQQQPHAPRLPLLQRAKPSRPPPPPPPPDHPAPPSRSPVASPQQQAVKCKGPPDGCERFATRIKKPAAATSHQVAPASTPSTAAPVSLTGSSSADSNLRTASTSCRPLEDDPEYSYLRSVLERGGFMRATAPSSHRPFFKGHSVASPVDPIVFHLLELELPTDDDPGRLGPLRHRWNRKLLFHLTQEILADLLLLGVDPLLLPHGPALLGKVWGRVRAFPAADCRVVGDIDALVATDLHAASVRGLAKHPAVAEEAGDVADDVAERILDALLGECC